MENWITIGASVKGQKNIISEKVCEDSNAYSAIDNWSIVVVADGAGSCENSATGSQIAVKNVLIYTKEFAENKLLKSEDYNDWENDSLDIVKKTIDKLKNYSNENDISFKSLSTTIILLIYNNNKIYSLNIGDGRAGYRDAQNKWHPVITPFQGEFAGETVFITSDIFSDVEKYISTNVIEDEINAVVVISDGAESICWEHNIIDKTSTSLKYLDPNKPFANFLDTIIEQINAMIISGLSQDEIIEKWNQYLLKGDTTIKEIDDDKTIVLSFLKEQAE